MNPPRVPARGPATLAGLCAVVLWSSLALLTTFTQGLPPFQVLAIGFAIGGGLGLLRTSLRGRTGWRNLQTTPGLLVLTVAGLFGYHALYFFALKHAPALEANLVNYLWPLLIVLFAAALPGERLRTGHVLGAVLGLAAAVVLVTRGRVIGLQADAMAGYLAALAAAVTWAAYSVLNRRHAGTGGDAITPACLVVALLGALAHLALEPRVVPTPAQWLALLAMGLGPVGAAFALWDRGTKHGDLALLGNLSYLAPLLSTLLLVAAGRAQAHWLQAVAIVLLLAAAWCGLRASQAGVREGVTA